MVKEQKLHKRGFVMTGGGAKGLYEAGVIHAFHITGMEFDVITGSSIGAMNSIFFAEYLFHKRQLPTDIRADPLKTIQALDGRVLAYHHAWLQMPDKRVIDDSAEGPIGRLKDDLAGFDLRLPLVTHLLWWWTNPDKQALPPAATWPGLARLFSQLIGHLGGLGEILRILKHHRADLTTELVRTYLARFDLAHSLVPPAEDHKLKDIFTQPVSPLRPEHLDGDTSAPDDPQVERYRLVDPARTLGEFDQQGITVRLTRANYRTGRLEISTHISPADFVRFMERQAWRLQVYNADKIPLGSFRLMVPGNPNAVNAALCSGRFPGVFSPYALSDIYPADDPENAVLYQMAQNWLGDPAVTQPLAQAYQEVHTGQDGHWQRLYEAWCNDPEMRDFFPRQGDTYVDGGAIDNTPSNSAIDYVREWVDATGRSRQAVKLKLFVIYLETEPKVTPDQARDPALYQVVNRTLAIQGAANRSSDANNVDTINTFGARASALGQALLALLDAYAQEAENLSPEARQRLQQRLVEQVRSLHLPRLHLDDPASAPERIRQWASGLLDQGLPLEVDAVRIYPASMPLSTLQFTARFGYLKENAILMITSGCADTLWTLRQQLENAGQDVDDLEQQALALARRWMGTGEWPAGPEAQEQLRQSWRCQRTECIYHARHCPKGASQL